MRDSAALSHRANGAADDHLNHDRLATRMDGAGPAFYVTAGEAYPEFERAVLSAQREISAGFRVFDLTTRLRSPEGQEIGEDWFDLLAHILQRGVRFRLILSDFDPALAPWIHAQSWRFMRQFASLRELLGPEAPLEVIPSLHPAKVGWLPRRALRPLVRRHLDAVAHQLDDEEPELREGILADAPGLKPCLTRSPEGKLCANARWAEAPRPVTHHQKIAVIDDRLLWVGGLDLDERRWDTKRHRRSADETWHDVQCMVQGPSVAEAKRHLETMLDSVASRHRPPKHRHFLTTLSARHKRTAWLRIAPRFRSHTIEDEIMRRVAAAKGFIYLESQYFRHIPLARALARAARENPELKLTMVLPAAPDDVAFDANRGMDARMGEYLQAACVRIVRRAFGDRLFIGSPAQTRDAEHATGRGKLHGAPIIYVHAKVCVFDGEAAMISSANLNGRSMRWDTEAGVCLTEPSEVELVRDRCFRHWLPEDASAEMFDPETATAAWAALARENRELPPARRRGFLMPYEAAPARRIGRPLPFVPDEMV